jgi:hypothetical protein
MAYVKSIIFRYIMVYYNRRRIYTSMPLIQRGPPAIYRERLFLTTPIKLAGEYVIEVAEYSDSLTRQGFQDVTYYQLKHTTVQKNNPFDLKLKIMGRQVWQRK